MRRALAEADRIHAIRDAVADLRRAGLVGDAALPRADALWPEPGPRAGWLGRSLAALFVSGAIGMLTLFFGQLVRGSSFAGLALVVGLLLAGATEAVLATPRLAFSGAAGTCGFWAWAFLFAGLLAAFDGRHEAPLVVLPFLAAAGLAAAWRWGLPLLAFLGTATIFAWLARLPGGRLLWVLAGAGGAALLARHLDRPRAPSHRDGIAAAFAAALSAAYAALNLWSVVEGTVEEIGGGQLGRPGAAWLAAGWWGTLLLPLAVLAWGIAARRRWLIGLGALFALLTAVTLRRFVHLAPLWELLILAGAALSLLALGLIRLLERRGEAAGYTDEPLLTRPGRGEALGTVALIASQIPAAHAAPREEGSRFASGGGDSGGGGASDAY